MPLSSGRETSGRKKEAQLDATSIFLCETSDKKPELSNRKSEMSWEVMGWLGSNTEEITF